MNAQGEHEILAQEERLTEATRNVDVAALDELYAEDIMFTGVTGAICDKRAASLRGRPPGRRRA
jgi:ketosteroid isomerase-like protein